MSQNRENKEKNLTHKEDREKIKSQKGNKGGNQNKSKSRSRNKSRSRSSSVNKKQIMKGEEEKKKIEEKKLNLVTNQANEIPQKADNNEEKKIYFSIEGYNTKGIINNFEDISYNLNDLNKLTLSERKEMAEKNKSKKKFNLEELLSMDQTNKSIQKKYLTLAVGMINKENKIQNIKILLEKIKKSSIVLDEADYIEITKKINKKYLDKIKYINYKECFDKTLTYIIKDESNLDEAKNMLNIQTIYKFNQPAIIGNNNYYNYRICIELYEKLDEIFIKYNIYTEIINYYIKFMKEKNLDELGEDIFKYKYLMEILLDSKSVKNKNQLKKVIIFLEGIKVNEEELKNAINNFKIKDLYDSKLKLFEYNLLYEQNNKNLKYSIIEYRKFAKRYKFEKTFNYNINLFNENIVEIIKKEFDDNFLPKLFENVLPNKNIIDEFDKDMRKEFDKIIKKILNSQAAIKFFNKTYKTKNFQYLEYHFNNPKVQDEILKNIIFAPLFNETDNAITSSTDLSIIINSIPYKFSSDDIPIFNRKILNFGSLIINGIHEIFGHYLRRYYSYLTGQKISLSTNDDSEIFTGYEGGSFVESEFLGINNQFELTIKNILGLFYEENYLEYPIIKTYDFEINENILKKIVEKNQNIFNFINLENDPKNDIIDNQKITILEYLQLINVNKRHTYSRKHCPGNYEDGLY